MATRSKVLLDSQVFASTCPADNFAPFTRHSSPDESRSHFPLYFRGKAIIGIDKSQNEMGEPFPFRYLLHNRNQEARSTFPGRVT